MRGWGYSTPLRSAHSVAFRNRDPDRSAVVVAFFEQCIGDFNCLRPHFRRQVPHCTRIVGLVPRHGAVMKIYSPAIIISLSLIVGETIAERHFRSLPIISIDMNISLRLPAIVISWTG
jgi:hypothetical protein